MSRFKKIILLVFSFFAATCGAMAQVGDGASATGVEMADAFRGDGKIYVVVAVLIIILIGVFIYLIRLDRKVSRLEKEV